MTKLPPSPVPNANGFNKRDRTTWHRGIIFPQRALLKWGNARAAATEQNVSTSSCTLKLDSMKPQSTHWSLTDDWNLQLSGSSPSVLFICVCESQHTKQNGGCWLNTFYLQMYVNKIRKLAWWSDQRDWEAQLMLVSMFKFRFYSLNCDYNYCGSPLKQVCTKTDQYKILKVNHIKVIKYFNVPWLPPPRPLVELNSMRSHSGGPWSGPRHPSRATSGNIRGVGLGKKMK